MKKKKKIVYRVQLGFPRPPVGPFEEKSEALAYARNNVRVPAGVDANEYLEERLLISMVEPASKEEADTYAPRKKRKILFDVPAMMAQRLVAA